MKDSSPNLNEDVKTLLEEISEATESINKMPEIDYGDLDELFSEIKEIMSVTAEYVKHEKRIDKALDELLEKIDTYGSLKTSVEEIDLEKLEILKQRLDWAELGVTK